MDGNTVIYFKNKRMTVQQLADECLHGNLEEAIQIIPVLEKQGAVRMAVGPKSQQQIAIETAAHQQEIIEKANLHDTMQEAALDNRAAQRRENEPLIPGIEIQYPNLYLAQQAEIAYKTTLRLQDTEISIRNGEVILLVRNITPSEYAYIKRTYTADKVTQGAVNAVNRGAEIVTGAVDYGAKKVVQPLLQVSAKSVVSILKTAATTIARTGSTLVTATAQGAKQVSREIKDDPDVLKARRELIEATNLAKSKLGNMSGSTGGIRLL